MSNEFNSGSDARKPNAIRRQLLAGSAALPLAGIVGYSPASIAQGATKTLNLSLIHI